MLTLLSWVRCIRIDDSKHWQILNYLENVLPAKTNVEILLDVYYQTAVLIWYDILNSAPPLLSATSTHCLLWKCECKTWTCSVQFLNLLPHGEVQNMLTCMSKCEFQISIQNEFIHSHPRCHIRVRCKYCTTHCCNGVNNFIAILQKTLLQCCGDINYNTLENVATMVLQCFYTILPAILLQHFVVSTDFNCSNISLQYCCNIAQHCWNVAAIWFCLLGYSVIPSGWQL